MSWNTELEMRSSNFNAYRFLFYCCLVVIIFQHISHTISVPPTPTVNITNKTSSSFTILWSIPATDIGQVENYVIVITPVGPEYDCNIVNCNLDNTSLTISRANNVTSYVFTTAKSDYYYDITVGANNSVGMAISEAKQILTDSGGM